MKNKFISKFKSQLYKFGLNIERSNSVNEILTFINKFKSNYIFINLIRVGGGGDGGYLVPNILENINFCFSAGVGEISNFERDLSKKYNIKSFLADASVNGPAINDRNFFFTQKFLSSVNNDENITLSNWLIQSDVKVDSGKILQMDIEGSEYEVLTYESLECLSKFSIIIIEFHKIQNITNPIFLKMIKAIFEKIYKNFKICHAHPNNFSGLYVYKGIQIPSSLEITFIRNDLIDQDKSSNEILLPHPLDEKNDKNLSDILMPESWWKK